jgi:hypothetical protein
MRNSLSFAILIALFVGWLALALLLGPKSEGWLVFQQSPSLYEELRDQGLTTSDGLLGIDGKPLGNFVIRTEAGDQAPFREEGMFRSITAAERYLGQRLLFPGQLPGWQTGAIRTNRTASGSGYHAAVEYRGSASQSHILASQASSTSAFEMPSGRGVAGRENHDVDGTRVDVFSLNVTQGSRLVGYWRSEGQAMTATLSTSESDPVSILLGFVARTLR